MAVIACAGSIALTARSAESTPVRLLGVSAQGRAILIEASEPVAYVVSRPDPLTVVVELREATVAEATNQVPRRDLVAGVTLEDGRSVDGKAVARVRVALAKPAESKVRSARNTIRLELAPASAPQNAGRAAPPPVHALLPTSAAPNADAPPEPGVATRIEGVQSSVAGGATVVTLTGNGRLVPTSVTETQDPPRRLVFDFAGVSSQAPAQTSVDGEIVRRVRVGVHSRSPLVTRVVMEIADGATYHLERPATDGRSLAIVFEAALAAGTATVGTPSASADVTPDVIPLQQALANGAALAPPPDAVGVDPMAALKAIGQVPPSQQAGPPAASIGPQAPASQPPAPQPPAPQPPAPPIQSPTSAPVSQQIGPETQKKYVGTPITLDFSGADLRTVLRVFADHSGLNILIDPGVPATPQDFLLKEIPWDQAMEIVLRANQLGYEVDGTVIRIAPLRVLEDEQKQQQSLTAARALAGDLRVRVFSLSYAKADAMSPLLVKSTLSQRGQIQVDTRTNTLIITDLADRLQTTADLIATLDRPEPQVEVEARIVTTSRDFARAIGIQWGLNGRMTPEIGNTTNLAFPNRGTIGGRVGGQQGAVGSDVRASPGDQTGTAVNLPAEGAPTSAIGLALGAVNGAFNLDVALSALESSGKGRVLSSPRLTTQNNVLAEIAQGVEIPIQTVSNNTVTVSFKDATLKLLVTPQITAAGTVIMQVEIHNAVPDFSRQVNGIPPIDTQRALTRVQVQDGETTVIGGIFVSSEQTNNDRTPGLSRVPLLGWLFKRNSVLDESRELLIFLTPRIIKG